MNQNYWKIQEPNKPLFPDVEWNKPEQRGARGNLLIIGGSAHGIAAVNKAYAVASQVGAGKIRVAIPDTFKKALPNNIDGIFLPTNPSGGISQDALVNLVAAVNWSDGVLMIGDTGQNSETATVFEKIINGAPTDKWITITRDAVDLLYGMGEALLGRPNTNLVTSFAQTQKLFSAVYYPKMLTFSMQLSTVVDALHKFTITYPVTLTVQHEGHIIVAHDGEVISQNGANPMALIDGSMATRAVSYLLWTPKQPLAAIASSWLNDPN